MFADALSNEFYIISQYTLAQAHALRLYGTKTWSIGFVAGPLSLAGEVCNVQIG